MRMSRRRAVQRNLAGMSVGEDSATPIAGTCAEMGAFHFSGHHSGIVVRRDRRPATADKSTTHAAGMTPCERWEGKGRFDLGYGLAPCQSAPPPEFE
jgi:hypothetical protein